MKKNAILMFAVGLVVGLILAGVAGWQMMPGTMIHTTPSPLGLEETVEKLTENAREEGWVVSGVVEMEKSIAKHGGEIQRPVRLVNLCQPDYASAILNDPAARKVSVMMPCTVAVYEDDNGITQVATMNAGLMGRMFGGTIAEVMSGPVATDTARMLAFLDQR
jgi:uncharacterized protein (DUF302 family)